MSTIIKPPAPLPPPDSRRSIFLAGSIEQGLAVNWQATIETALAELDVQILNPRRDDWDSTWKQSLHDPQFRTQVEWELDALERATHIAMYFDPQTKAPITLLELGLFARSGKVLVGCPEGYWRRGNIEVVCARFGIPLLGSLEELIAELRRLCEKP